MKIQKTEKNIKKKIGEFALRVRKSPTGKGLFTEESIPKDVRVIEYVGEEVAEAKQYTINSKYLFETGKDKMINGNIRRNLAKYINHSCKPNCEAGVVRGRIYISSLRKIQPEEELTYNYGEEYFDAYIKPKGCLCLKCKKN